FGTRQDVEYRIVLIQPAIVRTHERRTHGRNPLLNNSSRKLVEGSTGNPTRREFLQSFPVALERKPQWQAYDAIVVILQRSIESLTALNHDGLDGLNHWRSLEAHILGSRMVETRRHHPALNKRRQLLQANLLTNVVKGQN